MKKAALFTVFTLSLMVTAFFFYREGYKDGKENRFDA